MAILLVKRKGGYIKGSVKVQRVAYPKQQGLRRNSVGNDK